MSNKERQRERQRQFDVEREAEEAAKRDRAAHTLWAAIELLPVEEFVKEVLHRLANGERE